MVPTRIRRPGTWKERMIRELTHGKWTVQQASNRSPRIDFFGTIPDFSTTWRIGKRRQREIFTALRDKSELKRL
jgi:hypothetical protein